MTDTWRLITKEVSGMAEVISAMPEFFSIYWLSSNFLWKPLDTDCDIV